MMGTGLKDSVANCKSNCLNIIIVTQFLFNFQLHEAQVVFSLKYLFLVFTMLMSNFIANISFMGTGVGTWPQHATERGHMTTTTTTTTQALQCPLNTISVVS